VQKDIEAVKFILACFFKYPHDEEKRDKLIREKVLQNDMIAVYGMYSKDELKGILKLKERRAADELKLRREVADIELQKLALQNQLLGEELFACVFNPFSSHIDLVPLFCVFLLFQPLPGIHPLIPPLVRGVFPLSVNVSLVRRSLSLL
jgi:hypothetical protein